MQGSAKLVAEVTSTGDKSIGLWDALDDTVDGSEIRRSPVDW